MIFFEFSLPLFKSCLRYVPLCFFAAAGCRVFRFQRRHFFSNYAYIFLKLASLFSRPYCPDGLILTGHSHFWVAIWPVADCYNCLCNINVHMYLNILFDNSITSLITYHALSMELKFLISPEIFMQWQITLTDYKEYVHVAGKMDVSSTHQVSCVCILNVATSVCWLCV